MHHHWCRSAAAWRLFYSYRPLVTSPATVGVFVFCNLLYSAPVLFLHDNVTLISILIIIIIIIISKWHIAPKSRGESERIIIIIIIMVDAGSRFRVVAHWLLQRRARRVSESHHRQAATVQRVLNAAARVVTETRKYDRGLTDILRNELHWLSVLQRVKFKLGTMMFRCLRHSVPLYLSDFCTPVANVAARSQLRSARRHLVVVPRYNRSTYVKAVQLVGGSMVGRIYGKVWIGFGVEQSVAFTLMNGASGDDGTGEPN